MSVTQTTILPLKYGEFKIAYHKFPEGSCITATHGDVSNGSPVVRLHSSCLFGEAFHSLICECADQLSSTFQMIRSNGSGVIVYEYAEGRGIGLEKKIQAVELQRTAQLDTVEAFAEMGLDSDLRSYDISIRALNELAISRTIILATQNPKKAAAMRNSGFTIKNLLSPKVKVTSHNRPELLTKKLKLGYSIDTV